MKNLVVPKKPDQHESQLRKLDSILKGQEHINTLLKELAKGGGKPIDIQFSWPMDHELMQLVRELLTVVKDIQDRLAGGGGLSESQEQELANKLSVETEALQGAVEANQT